MVAWVKNEGQISKRKVGAVTTARSQKLRQLKQSESKSHRMIEDQAHIEADTGCLSEPDGWWKLAIIIDCT
jgi:hypothetical protein